jgi:hypothetical protein
MADNVNITAGAGTAVASDDIGGVQYQRVKVAIGADGSATDLSPGQKTMANSVPVVIASDQSGMAVDTEAASAASIANSLTGPITAGQIGSILLARNIYDGNFYTIHTTTMDVDAQSASERGLNTRAHLEAFNGSTYDRLRVDANKNLLVSLNTLLSGEDTTNGRLLTGPKPADADSILETLQNAATATGNGTAINMKGYTAASIHLQGTWVGTVQFEGTIDDTNWFNIGFMGGFDTTIISSSTVSGFWRMVDGLVLSQFRARISAYTSGSITVKTRKHAFR